MEHLFFVNNAWVAARDLRTGDLLFAFSGTKLRIDSLHQFKTDTATKVFIFEVVGIKDVYEVMKQYYKFYLVKNL